MWKNYQQSCVSVSCQKGSEEDDSSHNFDDEAVFSIEEADYRLHERGSDENSYLW